MLNMKYEIDHKSPIPLHAQVEELLREMIVQPDFKDGKLLPNEVDLAKRLGISRNTLRQALNKLVFEGHLVRKKGIGTKVADQQVNSRFKNWLSFTQEMKAKGLTPKTFEVSVSWVSPEHEVMEIFGISAEKQVLKLERLRGLENGPFVFFVSYFHPRVGLTGKEDFSRLLYEILEKDYSTIAKLSKEEISARAADAMLANKLNINIGDPILQRKRTVYDPGGRAIEYNLGYYKSDSFIYTIESERDI
jgi:GntR family transcriptional regulator